MLLSVVIPFYQVEHYIGACLDALAGLPEEDCEILLIDDCGRDASAAIAADYSAAHPNARVIRRAQNGGLSAARNTGLDAALAFGDVVSTGRNAPEWLRARADYVSEIAAQKHPFETEKLAAREGIEY